MVVCYFFIYAWVAVLFPQCFPVFLFIELKIMQDIVRFKVSQMVTVKILSPGR